MPKSSPYSTVERERWASLGSRMHTSVTPEQFEQLKGLNDQVSIQEVNDIYLPLAEMIHHRVMASMQLHHTLSSFLQLDGPKAPFILGIAGSVAAGKSTTARLLQVLLSQYDSHPQVDMVTTDGFLYPNAVLQSQGMMNKKGFPQSYDTKRLLRFLTDIKSGKPNVTAPMYSHLVYDIVPDQEQTINSPDILIVEGINVLQVSREGSIFVSDFFDYSIFVDASEQHLEQWYIERFNLLRTTAFQKPESYFHRFADLQEEEAQQLAQQIWRDINLVNLTENILPTKPRAELILVKGERHGVEKILMRK
ncbi:type I pantothenate kinase [Paenibacillus sp. UMB4589-SE434]|uniref:type I pantothenate kinase n=1 Tax=Paenibacillus sp. UMB4589-SE434 TaxID=3046314 RepID=UPI00254A9F85|nr:type I pantothenate kinase [Paenibacillus sp. UMB4589-SE434]MDK8182612.1 type I pantothenate kinase [Paenibacillus sp. UMB4589-SE434]